MDIEVEVGEAELHYAFRESIYPAMFNWGEEEEGEPSDEWCLTVVRNGLSVGSQQRVQPSLDEVWAYEVGSGVE